MESFGACFADYKILIYENNSIDETVALLTQHAKRNPHIYFVSETIDKDELPATRTENIARARNKVLDLARNPAYSDFQFLVMTDLDLLREWTIAEMIESIKKSDEWDAIFANGIFANQHYYYDRYAFRSAQYPFGPELLGEFYWDEALSSWFRYYDHESWIPVFSAFGGFAIYKTSVILQFSYSGTVTDALSEYYQVIASRIPSTSHHLNYYLKKNNILSWSGNLPIVFCENSKFEHIIKSAPFPITCCEHLPLHAAMALRGYGRFFVNPKMFVHYE